MSSLDRRSFLRLLAAASAWSVLPTEGRAQTPPSSRIGLGHIGVGGQGTGLLGIRNSDAVQSIAVCDVDRECAMKAAALVDASYADRVKSGTYKSCAVSSDFREVLARPDIDAVIIATPDHWHAAIACAAMEAGKDVYLEKPIATSISEGRAIVDVARRTGAVCTIGSMQRGMSNFRRAVDAVRNGFVGQVETVTVDLPDGMSARGNVKAPMAPQSVPEGFDYDMWLGPAPFVPYFKERCHWNWRWSFDYGGGQLTDWIGHHYDIAAWALGLNDQMPVKITEAKGAFPEDSTLFDTATKYEFRVHYADGRSVFVNSPGGEHGLRIVGDKGWVHATRAFFASSSPAIDRALPPSTGFRAPARSLMENFLDCVVSREAPTCTAYDGHCIAVAAHLANAAMRAGRSEVVFDAKTEQIVGADDANALLRRVYRAPWIHPV